MSLSILATWKSQFELFRHMAIDPLNPTSFELWELDGSE